MVYKGSLIKLLTKKKTIIKIHSEIIKQILIEIGIELKKIL